MFFLRYSFLITLAIMKLAFGVANPEQEQCYKTKVIVDGLRNPLAMVFLDNDSKMLVADQTGVIWLVSQKDGGSAIAEEFMDISGRVLTSEEPADERGLLGLCLDPEFRSNRLFYVFYSGSSERRNYDHDSVISRFQASYDNKLKGNKETELVILRIPQPHARQNGGQLFFGNDGFLYVTTGDGGDRRFSRFKKNSLRGKILRLDVRNASADVPYGIPPDNPFVNEPLAKGEVYAYGFRNPWRCSVDSHTEGTAVWSRIFCGDIGEHPRNEEDLNIIESGGRYGWFDDPNSKCNTSATCLQHIDKLPSEDKLPIHSYSHEDGQAVIVGPFYRGNQFPALHNRFIFADYVHGTIHMLEENKRGTWNSKKICVEYEHSSNEHHVLGIVSNENGNIFILTNTAMSNSKATGTIYKLMSSTGSGSKRQQSCIYSIITVVALYFIYNPSLLEFC